MFFDLTFNNALVYSILTILREVKDFMETVPSHRLKGIPIKVALVRRGLSQREAASLLHIRYSTFNMKLLGERHFTDEEKEKLASFLDEKPENLFPDNTDTQCEQNTQEQSAKVA